ncbi:MAG: N-acetylmuramoyl-L-alanine amidase [Rubrivivax sp.]|nr:N-acetylmuramoyl-L-alanine amidase [Rubrivivax sp.]
MADEVVWSGGKLVHAKVTDKVNAKIEKGALTVAHALVLHQTGAATAASSFSSYDKGENGAHFLIDTDGTLYQTARIDQKCWHVGKVRSRCMEMKSCTPEELKVANAILFKKGESYNVRIDNLYQHEAAKSYPDRFPLNEDSLGIEIVGSFDAKAQTYAAVTKDQNEALTWLVDVLTVKLALGSGDVFTHGAIGYKQPTEASTAQWTKP